MELIIISKKYGTHAVYYDDEDHELVNMFGWVIAKGKKGVFYARARVPNKLREEFKCDAIRMHRLLMGATKDQIVDHIDHNGLNNKKSNLRFASNKENTANTRIHVDSLTGYKGVTYIKQKRLYYARIRVNGKLISLGRTKDVKEAARRYNEAAVNHFGEFAHLNIIPNE